MNDMTCDHHKICSQPAASRAGGAAILSCRCRYCVLSNGGGACPGCGFAPVVA